MSGIRSITRRPNVAGSASAGSAPIYVDSDDNRLKIIPAGTGTTEVILQELGASSYERLITTRVLTAADAGKTFALALATGFTVTLPALSTVSNFSVNFVVEIAPTGADYIIIANAADLDLVAGQVYGADGATSGTNSIMTFSADQLNFVAAGGASKIGDQATFQQVGTAGWAGQAFVNLGGTSAVFSG